MNTRISYLYRDADNYKMYNECVVQGEITDEMKAKILSCLDSEEYFIPRAVGLPEERFNKWTDADHWWFELDEYGFEATDAPATINVSAEELVAEFERCSGCWESMAFAGFYEAEYGASHEPTFVLCLAADKDEFVNGSPSEVYEFNSVEECLAECAKQRSRVQEAGGQDYFAAYVVAEDGSNPWREIFVNLKQTEECLWFPLNCKKCVSVWYSPDEIYGDELRAKVELRNEDGTMGPSCTLICDESYGSGGLSYNHIKGMLSEICADFEVDSVSTIERNALTERIMVDFGLPSPSLSKQLSAVAAFATSNRGAQPPRVAPRAVDTKTQGEERCFEVIPL